MIRTLLALTLMSFAASANAETLQSGSFKVRYDNTQWEEQRSNHAGRVGIRILRNKKHKNHYTFVNTEMKPALGSYRASLKKSCARIKKLYGKMAEVRYEKSESRCYIGSSTSTGLREQYVYAARGPVKSMVEYFTLTTTFPKQNAKKSRKANRSLASKVGRK